VISFTINIPPVSRKINKISQNRPNPQLFFSGFNFFTIK
jgi:hypothetical protein